MTASHRATKPSKKSTSFRVGRVRAYLRGRVWYLCYQEHGQPPENVKSRQPARLKENPEIKSWGAIERLELCCGA